MSVRVSPEPRNSQQRVPALRWENPPSSLVRGEAGEITLALSNWDLKNSVPRYFLKGKTPENVIMEETPGEGAGADGVIRYRFRIIPLEGQSFTLPPLSFRAGDIQLEVPGLKISILAPNPAVPGQKAETAANPPVPESGISGETAAGEDPPDPDPAFPELETGVFFLFRG